MVETNLLSPSLQRGVLVAAAWPCLQPQSLGCLARRKQLSKMLLDKLLRMGVPSSTVWIVHLAKEYAALSPAPRGRAGVAVREA